MGKHQTSAELLEACRERLDPVALAKAQLDLAVDVGKGMFAESIRLVREGKYSEAFGTLIGQNLDMPLAAGILGKGGKFRAAVEAAEATGTVRRGVETAGRAAAGVGDAARLVARGLDDELLAVNPNLGPDGRIRTGEVIRVPMPERTGTGPGGDEIVTIVIPPPQGSSAPPAGAPSAGAQARSEEGWGSFLEGAIKGDFSDNDSWSKTAGQVVAGVVPFAGQAADARDTLAALNQVREGRPGGWLSLLAAGVGWFPGAGDALKGAVRGGRKVAGEAAEAALEQGARRVGKEAAGEVGEHAARGASAAEGASAIAPRRSAGLGEAASIDYRSTFFDANPEWRGQVVVHHGIERQVLQRYPGLLSEAELHSLENLRGIPKTGNPELHLSSIRRQWNEFYRTHPNPTKQQLLDFATKIDDDFGHLFRPPVRP